MHTRSARNKVDGTFSVKVWDWRGNLFAEGIFTDMRQADQFAADKERLLSVRNQAEKIFSPEPLTMDEILMSDDELLAELRA